MPIMELKTLAGQRKNELSWIEVAYAILEESGEIHHFNDLLMKLQEYLELNDDELNRFMARFYTDLNIDGRFISVGDNRWGLRLWFAIDEIDEETATSDEESAPRRRRKSKRSVYGDDVVDYDSDDPEDSDHYDEEFEDDDLDEDSDEDEDDDDIEYDRELDDFEDDPDELDDDLEDYDDEIGEIGEEYDEDEDHLDEDEEYDEDHE